MVVLRGESRSSPGIMSPDWETGRGFPFAPVGSSSFGVASGVPYAVQLGIDFGRKSLENPESGVIMYCRSGNNA
jgi:hypothetical protein